jgi:hypothetical protein
MIRFFSIISERERKKERKKDKGMMNERRSRRKYDKSIQEGKRKKEKKRKEKLLYSINCTCDRKSFT